MANKKDRAKLTAKADVIANPHLFFSITLDTGPEA
jgi:hypothetical protein